METLTTKELEEIRGGKWIYIADLDQWLWVNDDEPAPDGPGPSE